MKKYLFYTILIVSIGLIFLSSFAVIANAASTFSEGTLLRGPDFGIWVVSNNQKVKILSMDAFNKVGYSLNAWQQVSQATLDALPTANLVKLLGNPDVYRVESNLYKRKLSSVELFNSYGFDWKKIATVHSAILNEYPKAYLFKEINRSEVYLIEGQKKYWLTSMGLLCGVAPYTDELCPKCPNEDNCYAWISDQWAGSKIVEVNSYEINQYETRPFDYLSYDREAGA